MQWQEFLSSASISAVCTDSRQVVPGALFIACPGEHVDGRNYVQQAIERGAIGILYESEDGWEPGSSVKLTPMMPVIDLSEKLGEIAANFYHNPSHAMQVIGVTGTNGKTSCTHFIAESLSSLGKLCGIVGTLGNGLLSALHKTAYTTPDPILLQAALANMREQHAQAVAIEVSSHALVQGRVNGVKFHTAVYTQLSRDHLDYHQTMEAYANAKAQLFEWPELQYAVINIDDVWGEKFARRFSKSVNVITYSAQPDSHLPDVQATKITPLPAGFEVMVRTPWGEGKFCTSLLGRFNISNLLAVLSVLGLAEINLADALASISTLQTVAGRMQVFNSVNMPTIIVDYAHTPDALEKALLSLKEHCQGKLVCVFGCGGDRDRGKRSAMGEVAERFADQLILTNDNPRSEDQARIIDDICEGLSEPVKATIQLDRALAIQMAVQKAGVNDMVLIAGKGHETTQVIGSATHAFSDIQQVEALLNQTTLGVDNE